MEKVQSGAGAASAGATSANQNASKKAAFDSSIKAAQQNVGHSTHSHNNGPGGAGTGSQSSTSAAPSSSTGAAANNQATTAAPPRPTPNWVTAQGTTPNVDVNGLPQQTADFDQASIDATTPDFQNSYNSQRGAPTRDAFKPGVVPPQTNNDFQVGDSRAGTVNGEQFRFEIEGKRKLTEAEKDGIMNAIEFAQTNSGNGQGHVDPVKARQVLDNITVYEGKLNEAQTGNQLQGTNAFVNQNDPQNIFIDSRVQQDANGNVTSESMKGYNALLAHEAVHSLQGTGAMQYQPQVGDYEFSEEVAGGQALGHMDTESQATYVQAAHYHLANNPNALDEQRAAAAAAAP